LIWRFGAGLFLIVNVQILDDGAVLAIGATQGRGDRRRRRRPFDHFRWHSSVGRAPFS
jgi:hypothetical protein